MAKNDPKLDTPGKVFGYWRNLPEFQDFVRQCYYDDIADAYPRFYQSEEFAALLSLVLKHLNQTSGYLLDVGGGNGVATLAWRKAGFDAYLVEPDDDSIVGYGKLIEQFPDLPVISAYGESLPFPSELFEVVYIRQVLHHISDLPMFMQEIHRILRPQGVFLATREHVISHKEDLKLFHQNHPIHQYTLGENAFLLDEYVNSMKLAGFDVKQIIGPSSSVVNYAPRTEAEFSQNLIQKLSQQLGKPLAKLIVETPALKSILQSHLSWKDVTPGRLYSFVAVRS